MSKLTDVEIAKELARREDTRVRYLNEDFISSFALLQVLVHSLAKEKGWWDNQRETGTLLMLMVSELGEALEADRKDLNDDKLTDEKGLFVELADAVIRIMDFCEFKGVNLGELIVKKHEYNKGREYMHGGKKY